MVVLEVGAWLRGLVLVAGGSYACGWFELVAGSWFGYSARQFARWAWVKSDIMPVAQPAEFLGLPVRR